MENDESVNYTITYYSTPISEFCVTRRIENIFHKCMFDYNIPVELRNIIFDYYGKNGFSDHKIYSELVHLLKVYRKTNKHIGNYTYMTADELLYVYGFKVWRNLNSNQKYIIRRQSIEPLGYKLFILNIRNIQDI